jgi:hypothetical protein
MRRLLSHRPFRLYWAAMALSSFGGQFFNVALPWLVLQLTRSDMALGSVLMMAALPRAALMLAGGALSDRVPPERVLLLANGVRVLLTGGIAALVIMERAQVWHLYPLALAFGGLDALSGPASTAIIPRLVGDDELSSANGLVQSTSQVSGLGAPAPAGALIASAGIGASLAVSAVASALAAVALVLLPRAVRRARDPAVAALPAPDAPTLAGTMDVWRTSLRDPALRAYLVLLAATSLATSGPLAVGLPSLARIRFDGSLSLGLMLSAAGGGTLIGALLAGTGRRIRHRGPLLLGVNALGGVLLILFAYAPTVAWASSMLAIVACGASVVNVIVMTALQAHPNRAILGRLVAIVMFASVVLSPVSYFLAGLASAVTPVLLFGASGAMVLAATAHAAIGPGLRRLD